MQVNKKKNSLTDIELLKYSRQIVLPEIDIEGQQLLSEKSIAIIGVGGIGCPVSMYLTTAGIGQIVLIDHDFITHDNLSRQVLFNEQDISKNKASVAKEKLSIMNSQISIKAVESQIDHNSDINLFKNFDLLIDCTDNFQTRTFINAISLKARKPLLMGSALKLEGQVALFRNDIDDTPCYRCLYSELPNTKDACVNSGVLGSITGLIGSLVATECIKFLCNFGETLTDKLLIIDSKYNTFKSINFKKDNECKYCNQ